MTDYFRKYWPTLIVLGLILYATLSADPIGADDIPPIPHIDKLIHATMMGGLLSSIVFDIQRANRQTSVSRRTISVIAFAVMVFSIFDEITQAFMENGRSGDILDLAADWFGIGVAFFAAPPAIRKVLKIKDA